MEMKLVVRRLTRPLATTVATFMGVLRHYPYTGGATTAEFEQFIDIGISVAATGRQRDALSVLRMLPAQRAGGARGFPMLDFDMVIYQLVLRVLQPALIDQGGYGLCGPAAFGVMLAQTDPATFVQIAVELLCVGRSRLRAMALTPNDSIRNHRPDRTPHADWLMLASLRGSDDVVMDGMNRGEYGGSTFTQMVDWLKRAGYGTIVGAHAPLLTGAVKTLSSLPFVRDLDAWGSCDFHPLRPSFLNGIDLSRLVQQPMNLFLADRFCRNHWNVLLLVSEKYTQTKGTTDPVEAALEPLRAVGADIEGMRGRLITQMVGDKTNHWILVKEIHLTGDGMVRITRYSWGALETTAPISREMFFTIYGGFIAASVMNVEDAIANWHW